MSGKMRRQDRRGLSQVYVGEAPPTDREVGGLAGCVVSKNNKTGEDMHVKLGDLSQIQIC